MQLRVLAAKSLNRGVAFEQNTRYNICSVTLYENKHVLQYYQKYNINQCKSISGM